MRFCELHPGNRMRLTKIILNCIQFYMAAYNISANRWAKKQEDESRNRTREPETTKPVMLITKERKRHFGIKLKLWVLRNASAPPLQI